MKQTLSVARRARLHIVLAAIAVAALTVIAAGCDWAQPPAASVNGFNIPRSSFLREISAGKKGQPVDATKAAGFLSLRIGYAYFDQQAKKLGLTPSASTIKQLRSQVDQDQQYGSAPAAFKDWLAKAAAEQQAVAAHFDQIQGPRRTAFERQLYEQQGRTPQVCFHAIVTADAASANQAKKRITDGASFESVASQVSLDSTGKSQGGNYGCTDASQLASGSSPIASALQTSKVGQLFGPASFTASTGQTAYAIGRVDRRGIPTFAEFQQQNNSQFGQAYAVAQARRWLQQGKVRVDPQFGTWNRNTLQVDPPKGVPSKMAPPTTAPNTTTPQLSPSTAQGGGNG